MCSWEPLDSIPSDGFYMRPGFKVLAQQCCFVFRNIKNLKIDINKDSFVETGWLPGDEENSGETVVWSRAALGEARPCSCS